VAEVTRPVGPGGDAILAVVASGLAVVVAVLVWARMFGML
jgi:hypothetical protein